MRDTAGMRRKFAGRLRRMTWALLGISAAESDALGRAARRRAVADALVNIQECKRSAFSLQQAAQMSKDSRGGGDEMVSARASAYLHVGLP